jgi:uncharacterized Zn finger protein
MEDVMQIPNLDESVIRENTRSGSLERGKRYFENDAIVDLQQGERVVKARVKGSRPMPYIVEVNYDDSGVTDASCTCPYHKGAWCKHIVATLLAVLEGSAGDDVRAVTTLLEELDRDALLTLIERLVADQPELVDRIRSEIKFVR